MAENKKAILRRRRAVEATRKITRAMKLVAAAKLRRAQERALAARPYARELARLLQHLVAAGAGAQNPLLTRRESPSPQVAYVVITADRGLAGSYNVNVLRAAQAALRAEVRPVRLVTIGRKGRDFFTKRGLKPIREWVGIGEEARWPLAQEMVRELIDLYLKGEVDEVRIIYTEFINAVQQRPREIVLLPVTPPGAQPPGDHEQAAVEYFYEPNAEHVLGQLVPRYVETVFFQTLLEAKASEHGARMTAMGNATDNATELIARLTLQYNRARQAAITKEIAEIVGGAEALK
ncbi:ATP synthase F1 subunit gamma [Caldinitratiruptor microaerophilus]|uniref:ATP synthase gamma chain n=1 Tax=Caldinitratiruptor microaerophilus TaxID=671077 RepID=A0AA35CNJ8_9FIRM|nr:ATP synthase F1 subunit gamma [Caldinitratiruptor microaerophilus]BDG61764.1 ATP synthase subunit gamma [Caldinitratiruptor microaerophilus]